MRWLAALVIGVAFLAPPAHAQDHATCQRHVTRWNGVSESGDVAQMDAVIRYIPPVCVNLLREANRKRADALRPQSPAPGQPRPPRASPPTPAAPQIARLVGDRDCADCPAMVVVPAGRFTMGSPGTEVGRESDEGPQHPVNFARSFAIGRTEVMRREYAAFVRATSRQQPRNCYTDLRNDNTWRPDGDWREPGFVQEEDHPVVCVSREDARAYVDWLNGQVPGRPYRLPSEAEWEYAARAGSTGAFADGGGAAQLCGIANHADNGTRYPWRNTACNDGALNTVRASSFRPNAFGLYGMQGNAWEWVEDCYGEWLDDAPTDGRAAVQAGCTYGVTRGGGWSSHVQQLRFADRTRSAQTDRSSALGFRVARALP